MATPQRITPSLWFDTQAEEAANFYVSIFDNSRIGAITRYTMEAAQAWGQPEGSVMTVAFQLDGQDFTALNGGPHFKFNEAISLVVSCRSQAEVDHYWNRLAEGGDPAAQQCGCPGRWCPWNCRSCSATPTPPRRGVPWRRCCR